MSFYVSFYMSFFRNTKKFKKVKITPFRFAALHDFLNSSTPPFLRRLYLLQAVTVSRDKKARLRLYKNHLPNNHITRQNIAFTTTQTPGFSAPTKNKIKTFNQKRRKNPGSPPIANRYLYRHDKTSRGNINPTPTQTRATHKLIVLRQ